jgi:signal transduction histidine kinase
MTPEELEIVAEELPVAIWMGRVPSGEVVYTNRAFREVLGIEPPLGAARGGFVEPYGVHQLDGSPYPEQRMPYEQALAARATVVVDDLVIHRRDGRRVNLRVFAKPLFDEKGEITYILEAFTDITREVEAERAKLDGERKLARVQRLESLGQLVAGIAHDFNNILTVTKLVVGRLLPSEADESRRTALADVQTATDSAIALVRNLLGFAGNVRPLLAPLEVGSVVKSIVELAQRTFDPRIVVRTDGASEDAWIKGDRVQIEQIVMNLLVNARDALGSEGAIVATTSLRTLNAEEVEACPAGKYVVIEVTDNGSGIDPAIRERIFEPYFTTKTFGAVKGTGLGLAMVLGNVRAHGGFVEALDATPRGATIRIAIPMCAPPPADTSSNRDPSAVPLGAGELILVIDDEPLVRSATAKTLKSLGYKVLEADGGQAGVSLLGAHAAEVRGVILDMIMPGMSARETYEALREHKPDVRVLLVTGSAIGEEIERLLKLGAKGSLGKPFDRARIANAVHRLLRA